MRPFYARTTPWGTIQIGDFMCVLPPHERAAVLAHEEGHLHHRHTLKRLAWFLTLRAFVRPRAFFAMCAAQELEADRYAADHGHRDALAAFLYRRQFNARRTPGYPSTRRRLENLYV